jgi:hypothetical protein
VARWLQVDRWRKRLRADVSKRFVTFQYLSDKFGGSTTSQLSFQKKQEIEVDTKDRLC